KQISEESLLKEFTDFLYSLLARQDIKDDSCLRYLLFSQHLKQKGNFGCCLNDLNENTVENPFIIYQSIANPLWEENMHDLFVLPEVSKSDYTVTNNVSHPKRFNPESGR